MHLSFSVHDGQRLGNVGRSFLEYFKPLAAQRGCVTGEAGNISARASKTCNKATADRIANADKHNWYVSGDRLEYRQCRVAECHRNIRHSRHEFGSPVPHLIGLVIPPLHLGNHAAAFSPPKLVETSLETGKPASGPRRLGGAH
jgi:hypothetical protein